MTQEQEVPIEIEETEEMELKNAILQNMKRQRPTVNPKQGSGTNFKFLQT